MVIVALLGQYPIVPAEQHWFRREGSTAGAGITPTTREHRDWTSCPDLALEATCRALTLPCHVLGAA